MSNYDVVISHIKTRTESMYVDFKRDYYKNLCSTDFVKDVVSFANLDATEDCYIFFGIEDKSRRIVGIHPESYIGIDALDGYLERTVEPFIHIESDLIRFEGKTLAYIKICEDNKDRPYVIKENCGKNNQIEKGDIYLRKGTCNQKALRMDLDDMYSEKSVDI